MAKEGGLLSWEISVEILVTSPGYLGFLIWKVKKLDKILGSHLIFYVSEIQIRTDFLYKKCFFYKYDYKVSLSQNLYALTIWPVVLLEIWSGE